MHTHILHTHTTKFFVTALYSSVKQYYSKVISSQKTAHKRLTSFEGHGQQQRLYVSQIQRAPFSIHTFGELAYAIHSLKAQRYITA